MASASNRSCEAVKRPCISTTNSMHLECTPRGSIEMPSTVSGAMSFSFQSFGVPSKFDRRNVPPAAARKFACSCVSISSSRRHFQSDAASPADRRSDVHWSCAVLIFSNQCFAFTMNFYFPPVSTKQC